MNDQTLDQHQAMITRFSVYNGNNAKSGLVRLLVPCMCPRLQDCHPLLEKTRMLLCTKQNTLLHLIQQCITVWFARENRKLCSL